MKYIFASIIIAGALIGGAVIISRGGSDDSQEASVSNVSIVNGKQIIEINARGGYSPRLTNAKSEIPSVIRMKTQGTFDCSSALVIPALGYRSNLSSSGITDIEVPPQKSGTTLQGLCSMGMYSFSIKFE